MYKNCAPRLAISRAEVIVVCALLALGLAVAIPALLVSRESARQATCRKHLTELGRGLLAVVQREKAFPPGTVVRPNLEPEKRLSWYVGNFPDFLPRASLIIHLDQPWDSAENLHPKLELAPAGPEHKQTQVDFRRFSTAQCPSAPASSHSPPELPDIASYLGIAGLGSDAPRLPRTDPRSGIWGYDRSTPPDEIKKGTATVMLLAETARHNGPWTAGGPPTVRGIVMDQPLLGVGAQLGGLHPNVCNTLFADGAVHVLNDAIDPSVLARLLVVRTDAAQ